MLSGALGKARGHVLRLSTILEHLWWAGEHKGAEPEVISRQAVAAAIRLLEDYYIPTAERVFGDAAIPLVERNAMALARHVRSHRLMVFNARALRREIGGALRDSAPMDAACHALVEAGLIRPRFERAGGSGGKPARNYEINPVVLGGHP